MTKSRKKQRLKTRIWKHHLPLAGISLLASYFVNTRVQSDYIIHRWSMATGYVGLTLLVITLILGPLKALSGKKYPRSDDLRRDFGIWCAIVSLAHLVIGIQVHMGNPWLYFFLKDSFPQKLVLRGDLFGFANYTGLAASLIVLLLLLLSNDYSMKILGGKRWKNIQRWSYGIFILVIAHCIAYQVIEDRAFWFLALFTLLVASATALQLIVFFRRRGKAASPSKEQVQVR